MEIFILIVTLVNVLCIGFCLLILFAIFKAYKKSITKIDKTNKKNGYFQKK